MKGRLTDAINNAYDTEPASSYRSSRIGASIIGSACEAYLAFVIRGFPDSSHPSNLKRIFRDGHTLEKSVLKDLKKAGLDVQETDPMTGTQFCWSLNEGHMVFYADGIVTHPGEDAMLLEIKSMNDAMWKRFSGKGVQVSHPKYYAQLQMGMGLSGFRKAVIIGYNKNTSKYHDEEVEFDPIFYANLLVKAERVLRGEAVKVSKDETDWRCRECPKFASCWKDAPVVADKRTCANAFPTHGGQWGCKLGCGETCMSYERYKPKDKV